MFVQVDDPNKTAGVQMSYQASFLCYYCCFLSMSEIAMIQAISLSISENKLDKKDRGTWNKQPAQNWSQKYSTINLENKSNLVSVGRILQIKLW